MGLDPVGARWAVMEHLPQRVLSGREHHKTHIGQEVGRDRGHPFKEEGGGGLSQEVACSRDLKEGNTSGKRGCGRRHSRCKDPEAGRSLVSAWTASRLLWPEPSVGGDGGRRR